MKSFGVHGSSSFGRARVVQAAIALHLLLLIAAADFTAVEFYGASIRLAWLLIPAVAMLVRKSYHDNVWLALAAGLLLTHLISALFSLAPLKGVIYSGWIAFSYFTFFRIAANCAYTLGSDTWTVLLTNGRLQIIGALAFVAMGIHDRAQFTYYEPSYLAIALVPYFGAALFVSRRKWFDALLVASLLTNQSANLLLVIAVTVLFWVCVTGLRLQTVAIILAIPLALGTMFASALVDPENANHGIANWIAENGISVDLVQAALERGGNRFPRMEAAWDAAVAHPLLGVGPGVYAQYTENIDFSEISEGMSWLDPSGLPAVNVVLEAITNAGVLAALELAAVFAVLWHRVARSPPSAARDSMLAGLLTIGIAMQFESNYLRAYLWVAFGVYAALSARNFRTVRQEARKSSYALAH